MTATISKIEVFCIGMPLVGTFTSGGVSKNVTKCVVVRATAADGASGISSIDPSSTATSPGRTASRMARRNAESRTRSDKYSRCSSRMSDMMDG